MKKYLAGISIATLCTLLACTNSSNDNPGFSRERVTTTDGKPDGQALFVQNCAACHQKERDLVGPALQGVLARWDGDKARLYAFIKNNQEAVAKGDPRAVEVKKKWGATMPAFPQLTDAQIDAILTYVE